MSFALPLDTPPMEARTAETLPEGDWQYEPKWDGFRCLAFKSGSAVELRAKSGKPLGRYFPEVVAMLQNTRPEQFVLDGELVIQIGAQFSFDALQARLHPAASRIRKLAAETPARLIAFDLLADATGSLLLGEPVATRRPKLEAFLAPGSTPEYLSLSPATRALPAAKRWLGDAGQGTTDGVIAKRLTDVYAPGERTMLKVKRLRSADCVVGGFRYESKSQQVGSLLLGLYNQHGQLDHVGFTVVAGAERAALTTRLEALRQPPGFSGNAPGGPSRWSTERSASWEPLRPELVVEVRFDHVSEGRFRHGTKLLRWRPDKAPRQCTFEQIEPAG